MRSDWFPLLTLYPVAGKGIIPCWWDGKENIITFWPFLVLLRSPAICIHRIKKSRLLYSVIRSGLVFCIAIKRLKQISILLWGLSACQIVFSLFYDFFYQYILGLNFIGTIWTICLFYLSSVCDSLGSSDLFLISSCLTKPSLYLFIYPREKRYVIISALVSGI